METAGAGRRGDLFLGHPDVDGGHLGEAVAPEVAVGPQIRVAPEVTVGPQVGIAPEVTVRPQVGVAPQVAVGVKGGVAPQVPAMRPSPRLEYERHCGAIPGSYFWR